MNKKFRNAFSLIEVMVSLVILLIGVMGLAVALQRNIHATNSVKNDTQAMLLAYSILEELETRSFNDIEAEIDSVLAQFQTSFKGEQVTSDSYFTPTITIDQAEDSWIQLTISVSWTGSEGETAEAGFGKPTTVSAFTLNTTLSRQYGDQLMGN